MRRRVSKLLLREAQVVDCGTIEDAAAAERWVRARAARENAPLEPAAVRALVERAGLDIGRLRAALERVALYAMGQKTISAADVAESVSPGPEAQADFGIAKAIWRDDAREALRELARALDAGAAPFLVLGQLRAAAERLAPARVSAAHGCRAADGPRPEVVGRRGVGAAGAAGGGALWCPGARSAPQGDCSLAWNRRG